MNAQHLICLLLLLASTTPTTVLGGQKRGFFQPVKEWDFIDFHFDSEQQRSEFLQSGEFAPMAALPIDVQPVYAANGRLRVFLTMPRFAPGTPATLAYYEDDAYGELTPFPDWSWFREPASCAQDRLVSVYRVHLDECGRLWVLDTGRYQDVMVCPPQIIAFDPWSKRVLHRYEIPADQYNCQSILVTPAVDVRGNLPQCQDTFIYMADIQYFGLIVYDMYRGRSWRVSNKLMYPEKDFGTFKINGESFDLMDGILGLGLSPYRPGEDRTLFFSCLASDRQSYVSTSLLRNGSAFEGSAEGPNPRLFKEYKKRRPGQSAGFAVDSRGTSYFGLVSLNAMACWDTESEYGGRNLNIIDRNCHTLQFAAGVKVARNSRGLEEVWVLTNRLQKTYNGSYRNETNFRLLVASVDEMLASGMCKSRRRDQRPMPSYHLDDDSSCSGEETWTNKLDAIAFPSN